jgi:hypothetical protein
VTSSDWDLAQRLIERGFCTLDQAREALAVQDRMRKRGESPPPLPRLLLEKGFVSREQLASLGLAPPPGPAAPAGPARPEARPSLRGIRLAAAGLAFAVALGIALFVSLWERPPGPVPAPADPASADRAIGEELERIAADQSGAKDFENAEEIVRRYRAFMGRYTGRKWELEAHGRLQEYRRRLEERARAELEAIRKREPELVGQGRMPELLALYRAFPARFLGTTDSGAEAADRMAEISRGMKQSFLRGKEEALNLLSQDRLDEALAAVKTLEPNVPEGRGEEVAALRARIEREGRSLASRLRREIGDEYLKLDGRFREAMARRNPREAAAAVGEYLFRPWKEEELRVVRVDGADYEALRKAIADWKPSEIAAVADAAGDPERPTPAQAALLDLRSAAFVGLFLDEAARAYRAAAESGSPPGPLGSLGDEHLVALGMKSAPDDAARHAQAGFFCYYSSRGRRSLAYEHLGRAHEKGVKGIRPYLANLGKAEEEERARELEVKLAAAGDCVLRKEWVTAKSLLEEIRRHEDHPFVKGRAERISQMLGEVTQSLLAEKRFAEVYRGKVEPLDGGRLRAMYDFEDPSQLEAFEPVVDEGRSPLRGRWTVAEGALESGFDTSASRWRTPVRGDVTVEYDLTPMENPQNIVLALYNNRGRNRHYSVVFGFDWVGKSEGDKDNTAEDRFGMPRTCVIRYPVAAAKARWREAEAWEPWLSRLVGKAAVPWRPERGKTARVRVAREGKGIRVEADGKTVWEGEDDACSEGHLLFFSDCRCRLDNLRIEFGP